MPAQARMDLESITFWMMNRRVFCSVIYFVGVERGTEVFALSR
jgi:hypothetical protein